jgi:hypothetical protein
MDKRNLSHTRWDFKYHVLFAYVNSLRVVFLVKKFFWFWADTLDIIRAEYFDKCKELSLFYLSYDNILLSTFLNIFLTDY